MSYVLSAQPIDDQGRIGFEDAPPLVSDAETLPECFAAMAQQLEDVVPTYPDQAWDLTLEVRE